MVKKIFFFIFAVLTLLSVLLSIGTIVAAKQEYERVNALPGNRSGVDYLAACITEGMANFFGMLSFVNAIVTTFLGFAVDWKKKKVFDE